MKWTEPKAPKERNINRQVYTMNQIIVVPGEEMQETFLSILLKEGFDEERAETCAKVFTENSVDGVYTHGVNRFSVFIQYIKEKLVDKDAGPEMISAFNGIEQWNGNLGPGPLNAIKATQRAIELAQQHGIGCLALSNTNHWMRGGYYGWIAAKQGVALIAWTNTVANMPAWGAVNAKLGNNPLVIAIPYKKEAIVLDMAMSQYSFGALELAAAKSEQLSVHGGYDTNGNLTTDPSSIIDSKRTMPAGYWKGAGLALLLDILAAILSNGLSTSQISQLPKEHSVSQVFVCIDLKKMSNYPSIENVISAIIDDYHRSQMEQDGKMALYPGERVLQTRKENLKNGIPVLRSVWDEILKLKQ
jgi:3-dehydro-L-gulonate 2-dehydrogenase